MTRKSFLLLFILACPALIFAADNVNIVANDNRSPAGELRNGVLTLKLDLVAGQWHPESEDGVALPAYAFADSGRPPQTPGPLIRVPQATEIHATVHNTLPVAVTVHGLHDRPGDDNAAFTLPPDATRDVRFKTNAAGTYSYWAATNSKSIADRAAEETQLSGALIVDPPGALEKDRVFVISLWSPDRFAPGADGLLVAINGKSWPYTERFTFKISEPVRWRWLNTSAVNHAMHLHGFYYHVNAVGDGDHQKVFDPESRPLVVTRRVDPGGTFDMSWAPERSGNWLFHCHMLAHMSPQTPPPGLVPASVSSHRHHDELEIAGMGGLVLGITVLPDNSAAKPPAWKPERKLQLVIDDRKSGRPLYQVDVRDPAQPASPSSPGKKTSLLGPPIVLTRGQPVEIEVTNHLKQPTAIHWHGIELESYYDGVPGWTGTTAQTTPPIAPGGSFVARMTPPRDGTFIYHTHWHDELQLTNGVYGPLIVLPPGEKLDPARDQTFLFSLGEFEPFGPMLLINGNPQPPPLRLKTGTKYRFRLINIAPDNVALRTSLRLSGSNVQWRIIAKDGATLPPAAATMATADLPVTVGETYDVEYQAAAPQELELQVYLPGPKLRTTQTLLFAPPGN